MLLPALISVSCSRPNQPAAGSVPGIQVAEVPDRYKKLQQPGLSVTEVEAFRAQLLYDTISLHRSSCYGACPVYRVTFHRSGKAELLAINNLPLRGAYTGAIDLISYGRLCYLLDQSKFAEMKSNYRSGWTDLATCTVTAAGASTSKTVSDYGEVGPIELWAIQEIIDRMREGTKWEKVGS
jgi:hypothetical protein